MNIWDLYFHTFKGQKKTEKVFVAIEIMKQLGYSGGNRVLHNLELDEGVDKITLKKKDYPNFLNQLNTLNVLGSRAGSVIMLYESGVWKLIMQSKKPIGVKTRNWLTREVLTSINAKGYYSIEESELNPFSYFK